MDSSTDNRKKLYIPIILNSFLGISNRILQIIDYCFNNYKYDNYKFMTDEIKKAGLTFCILPTIVNIFMMGLYCIFHYEENMTPKIKVKNFFLYILSIETLFPFGAQLSLKTKYSYNADNPLITMRLINAVHFMLVALPQLLIISINGSANEYGLQKLDIISLVISCIFIVWSVGYYFICIVNTDQYDDLIAEYVEKHSKNEKNE